MTDFEDETGGQVGVLVQQAVERELTEDGRVSLVPRERVAGILARMRRTGDRLSELDTALEVARRDGNIGAVVTGRLHQTVDERVLTLQVTSHAGQAYSTFVARGNSERSLMTTAAREAAAIREALRQFVPDPARRLPAVTTSSFAALQLFDQAVQNPEETYNTRHRPRAIDLLQNALEEDPEFAMARIWLMIKQSRSDDNLLSNFGEAPKPNELYRDQAQASLVSAKNVSRPERLFIEGAAYALLEEDERAIAAFEALLWSTSDFFEIDTREFLVDLYARRGQFEKSDEQALKLADLAPTDFYGNFRAAEVTRYDGKGTPDSPRLTFRGHGSF